jgi:hypothetical protein
MQAAAVGENLNGFPSQVAHNNNLEGWGLAIATVGIGAKGI